MNWNIGCSGFSYKEWKGLFYPEKLPQSKWFAFYAEHFNTLELNVSFYRFPTQKLLQNWYEKSPAGFIFSIKAPRLITHYKQLSGTETMLEDFYTTCREGLKEKLGPILFQFPPKFSCTEERMDKIISSLDNSFINVTEFRHSSWWEKSVFDELGKQDIIFSGASYPGLPDEVIVNTSTIYYRFHGVPKIYYDEYDKKFLRAITKKMLGNNTVRNVYCYFNNTATMAAINNGRYIQQLLLKK